MRTKGVATTPLSVGPPKTRETVPASATQEMSHDPICSANGMGSGKGCSSGTMAGAKRHLERHK